MVDVNLLPHGCGELRVRTAVHAEAMIAAAMRSSASSLGAEMGRLRSRTASSNWKTAVLAPMTSARVRMTTEEKPGLFANPR
ncbi:MAG: hypothetical protein WB679_18410 [Terracidiphilus sp.]